MVSSAEFWNKSSFVIAGWLVANLVFVGVWDITAYATGQESSTVSSVFRAWSHAFPQLPLLVGLLLGHLFWT